MTHDVLMLDFIDYTDTVDSTPKVGTLEDALSFYESILNNLHFVDFSDVLVFQDRFAQGAGSSLNLTWSDTLVFSDTIHPRVHIGDFEDFWFIRDELIAVPHQLLADSLNFGETWTASGSHAILDTVVWTDSLTVLSERNMELSETLPLTDGLTVYVDDPWLPIFPIIEEA